MSVDPVYSTAVEMFAWFILAYGVVVIVALVFSAITGVGFGSPRVPKVPKYPHTPEPRP